MSHQRFINNERAVSHLSIQQLKFNQNDQYNSSTFLDKIKNKYIYTSSFIFQQINAACYPCNFETLGSAEPSEETG